MNELFHIDLILLRIFEHLSDQDLFCCRLVYSLWAMLIDEYFTEIKLFQWKRTDQILRKMKSENFILWHSKKSQFVKCPQKGLKMNLFSNLKGTFLCIKSTLSSSSKFNVFLSTPLDQEYQLVGNFTIHQQFTLDGRRHYFVVASNRDKSCLIDYTFLPHVDFIFALPNIKLNRWKTFGDYYLQKTFPHSDMFIPHYSQIPSINQSKFDKILYDGIKDDVSVISIKSVNLQFIAVGFNIRNTTKLIVKVYQGCSFCYSKEVHNSLFRFEHHLSSINALLVCNHYLIFLHASVMFLYDLLNAKDNNYASYRCPTRNIRQIRNLDANHFIASFDRDESSEFSIVICNVKTIDFQLIKPQRYFTMSMIHQIDDKHFDLYSTSDKFKQTPFRITLN